MTVVVVVVVVVVAVAVAVAVVVVVVVVVAAHAALIPWPWIAAPLPRTTVRTGGKHCEAAALHGRGQASSWCILVPCFFKAAVLQPEVTYDHFKN